MCSRIEINYLHHNHISNYSIRDRKWYSSNLDRPQFVEHSGKMLPHCLENPYCGSKSSPFDYGNDKDVENPQHAPWIEFLDIVGIHTWGSLRYQQRDRCVDRFV